MIDKEVAEFAVNELEKAIIEAQITETQGNQIYVDRLKRELVEVIMTGSYQQYANNRIGK